MKKIFKLAFLFVMILLLGGCKNHEINLADFALKDGIYMREVSSDMDWFDLTEIKEENAELKFFKNQAAKEEISELNLDPGDNIFYAEGRFKDGFTTSFELNIYRLKKYTVKFVTHCPVKIEDLVLEEGEEIERPVAQFTKRGYTFKGWDCSFIGGIKEDKEIHAKWENNRYDVILDPNGGEINQTEDTVTYDKAFELAVPLKDGWDFVGWEHDGELISTDVWRIVPDEGKVLLKARYEEAEITYSIDYDMVGCANAPYFPHSYTNKKGVVLRRPYKCGYRFVGWYKEDSPERVYEIPDGSHGNVYLHARFEKFDLHDAKISFLGDSISTFYAEGSPVCSAYGGKDQFFYPVYSREVKSVEQTWWHKVYTRLGCQLLRNDSLSGSCCYNGGSNERLSGMNYNRINTLKGSDIVVIFLGTNDLANGYAPKLFYKAYDTMLARIEEVCPDAYLFCVKLGYSAYKKGNYSDENRLEYNRIIKELAEAHDFKDAIVNLDQIQTEETYKNILGDAFHPNSNGMGIIADEVYRVIKEYCSSY